MSLDMSFSAIQTADLWKAFMPRRMEIAPTKGPELYSIESYPTADFFTSFDPNCTFTKQAGVAVPKETAVPEGMESWIIPEGMYAVFLYTGKNTEATPFYTAILRTWLPQSEYRLDHRPHMAIMDHRYKNNDPDSQEEIWIPVKPK